MLGINDSDDPVAVEGLLRRFPWLRGLPEAPGMCYTSSEHEQDNSWLTSDKPDNWTPISWADGSSLDWPCNGIAVKFDDNKHTFWQHITYMNMAEAVRRLNSH